MIEDNKIVDLFWNREEGAIKVLDEKYGNDNRRQENAKIRMRRIL